MKKSILNQINLLNLKNNETWVNEALFGYDQIKKYLLNLNPEDNVLEIGCGSGILLSLIKENHQYINLLGIEPFGSGFDHLRQLNKLTKSNGAEIEIVGFEEFETDKKYNLIYSINVFEHVYDWKMFLNKAKNLLKKDGKLIILCPNYGFPYECHFGIPIIFNKKITYFIFKNFINNFEKNNAHGLWKSLNFVKKREVKNFLKKSKNHSNFKMIDDRKIVDYMISRSLKDNKFRERQKFISFAANLLKKMGIIKILMLFPDFLPYMKLVLFIEN